ncbi:alginate O-acetyltransferase [Rhizobium sp. RHZ01]|uniref:alginate O-acetyltransferase n=1 Tax=Rhizobium sp. RHZ01 TaxID=2769304 RepID=UPI001785F3DE|nr:alginate O-acetyltransferase [Rhizobium sp. RHZ01]MBD9444201.1 alginate O-acetyltransferase [Rhizobium sp. RHZ01]
MFERAMPITKFLLPALLFGYAAFANVDIRDKIAGAFSRLPTDGGSLSHGMLGDGLDALYKTELPHRELAFDLIGAARYMVLGEGRRGVIVGKEGWLFSDEEFRGAASAEAGISDATREIAKIAATLRTHGVRLIVVPLPAKNDVYREHLADPRYAEISRDRYLDFTRAMASANIEFVDARAALLEMKSRGSVFLKTDTHWTPLGAKAVAEATGARAGVSPMAQYALNDAPSEDVRGDLVKFVTGRALAAAIGLADESITPQTASQTGSDALNDILADESFPTVLVGTSYSANEAWSFASYLEAALGSNVLNVAEVGRGPVFPMHKFLSNANGTSWPETVIWEFPIRYLTDPALWKSDDLETKE